MEKKTVAELSVENDELRIENAQLRILLRGISEHGWENTIKPAGRAKAIEAYCFPRALIGLIRIALGEETS